MPYNHSETIPVSIQRESEGGISIVWSKNKKSFISSKTLRDNCPCAECRSKRGDTSHDSPIPIKKPSLLKVIDTAKGDSLKLESVYSIGNYAIGFIWGDKHNSGIYRFELLYNL